MVVRELPTRRARRFGTMFFVGVILAVLIGGRWIAQLIIEYQWWKELGQVQTWESIILYSFAPVALGALVAFVFLWLVHARALKFAGTGLREHPAYARLSSLVLLLLSILIARASLDSWTTVSFYGAHRAGVAANAWRDPIFGHTLSFYLFELPFWSQLLGLVLGIALAGALLFYLAARAWQLSRTAHRWRDESDVTLQPSDLMLSGGFESAILRGLVAIVLLAFAAQAFLGRYELMQQDHGFLVGIDYLAHHVTVPLQWLAFGALLAAAVLVLAGRWKLAAAAVVLVLLRGIVPPIVSAAYVKPNEISLQRPYIQHHIAATRAAYGLDSRLKEIVFPAKLESNIEPEKNAPLLENVRLWDWRAFHDTVTQIQALRQYYVFPDTDVDRYNIDGRLRQVMLSPRELDIRQLPDARTNWINAHFIYTHGYGMVMAEANEITPNGQPVLFVQDAPPKLQTQSLKLTRPEIYYGEVVHEPVFVRTQQPEFNYPSGSDNVHTRYEGRGGIPISGFGMRVAAAVALADRNVLLTGYLTNESRMMINRNIRQRVSKLANFIEWDPDPYMVVTDEGRLVWTIDGYTRSSQHPYSRRLGLPNSGPVNYIRNSVKATIDAYDGTVQMYVFDPEDPVIRAFSAILPALFRPASEMPSDLRAHARYPELLFRAQAEIYRTFHMQDPEAFYNREDLWDIAKNVYAQSNEPEPLPPTFVVATLPGQDTPEFLLVQPFTPRSKDNLIGVMLARSDGEHLGEIVVLQLSKQSLIYGPLQVEARIGSDSEISKDLALWNQQGSQVLRGQMLVLPINDTFLYVEPIYTQTAQARMPQLKKVVLAMGNTMVYRDTYKEALAALTGRQPAQARPAEVTTSSTGPPPATATPPAPSGDRRIEEVRGHLRRYRELSSQGRWAEAGRELEALERLVNPQ
jgi:uncharacterized membrane protein (UPF0182 family)